MVLGGEVPHSFFGGSANGLWRKSQARSFALKKGLRLTAFELQAEKWPERSKPKKGILKRGGSGEKEKEVRVKQRKKREKFFGCR